MLGSHQAWRDKQVGPFFFSDHMKWVISRGCEGRWFLRSLEDSITTRRTALPGLASLPTHNGTPGHLAQQSESVRSHKTPDVTHT